MSSVIIKSNKKTPLASPKLKTTDTKVGLLLKKKKKKSNTHPLLVWVNISNAKVVFLQQVEMVADKVKQVLSLGITLKEKKIRGNVYMCYWGTFKCEGRRKKKSSPTPIFAYSLT